MTQFYVFEAERFQRALLDMSLTTPASAVMLMHALGDPEPVVFHCAECGCSIWYQDCPTGGWWIHDAPGKDDRHDAKCGGYGSYDDD